MEPFGVLPVSYVIASVMNETKMFLPSKMSNSFDFKPNRSVTVLGNKDASINILESLPSKMQFLILTNNVP